MDFQQKLRNFLNNAGNTVNNFAHGIQQTAQPAVSFAQNLINNAGATQANIGTASRGFGQGVQNAVGYGVNTLGQNINLVRTNPVFAQQLPSMVNSGIQNLTTQAFNNQVVRDAFGPYAPVVGEVAGRTLGGLDQAFTGALTTPFTNKPILQKAGDVIGGVGATVFPIASITGAAISPALQIGKNLIDRKPITNNLGQAYSEGLNFSSKVGPLSEAVGVIPFAKVVGQPVENAINRVAPNVVKPLSNALGGIGANVAKEAATGFGYGSITGENPLTTAAQFGATGLVGAGKYSKKLEDLKTQGLAKTQYNTKVAPSDADQILKTVERLVFNKDDANYEIQYKPKDEKILRQYASDYINKDFAKKASLQDIAQELTNRVKFDQQERPVTLPDGLGLVDNNLLNDSKMQLPETQIPPQELRSSVRPGSYTNVRSIDNKLAPSNPEPLPWEANNQPVNETNLKVDNGVPSTIGQSKVGLETTPQAAATSRLNQTEGSSLPKQIGEGQQWPRTLRDLELKRAQQEVGQPQTILQKAEMARQASTPEGKVNQSAPPLDDIIKGSDIKVKDKVGLLDYLRTPDRVLQKIGLGNEAEALRKAYDSYLTELTQHIDKITQWSKEVPAESNQRIFQYLDGQKVELNPTELKVASEVKDYLKEWANRLKLPEDRRISNYITHIFDQDLIQKEFDPELAKLIRDKVPGSVYDPFTLQRLGKLGYKEDTWAALDAYVKRGVRKANLDPVLSIISSKADNLEESQFDYVKSYIDRVNMRPTKIDNLLDNTIKQLVGYKFGQRPTTVLSQRLRQAVYRGTLGLNIGSALRNLTQGVNTYAKLGEKYTIIGYTQLAKSILTRSNELEEAGILGRDVVQDRTISATKQFWQKADTKLFRFFEGAEKVNRGAAYFGAKAKALSEGKSEAEAIDFAKKIVRDTQFQFGSIDTPVAMQSDLAKTLGQFQSYNLKQAEFLGELIKNKDYAALARYAGASTVVLLTVGKALGMKPSDFIPFMGVVTGDTKLGQTPPIKLAQDAVGAIVGTKDKYGNTPSITDRLKTVGNDLVPFIPAGTQIKKSIQGFNTVNQGGVFKKNGDQKFPVEKSSLNFVRGALFGASNLPESQAYYNKSKDSTPTVNPPAANQAEASVAPDPSTPLGQLAIKKQLADIAKQEKQIVQQNGSSGFFGIGGTPGLTDDQKNQQIASLEEQKKTLQKMLTNATAKAQLNQKEAEYQLEADRAKRLKDYSSFATNALSYIDALTQYQKSLSPNVDAAEIAKIQNKIEDVKAQLAKYTARGGTGSGGRKGRVGRARSINFTRGALSSLRSRTRTINPPKVSARAFKVGMINSKPLKIPQFKGKPMKIKSN